MSTERIDTSQGTDRMDLGTARMDAGTARIGDTQGVIPTVGGIIFAEGQTIILNGKNCIIENLISKGSGEAVVYKIKMNDKHYALKHYKPNTPLSNTAKKVLTKIKDNPRERVVKIIDIGSYHGQDFEIMEYAEGGTLSEFVRKHGAVRDSKLKDLAVQINEGLQQLHGFYKIIYQDLKPDNIFFKDAQRTSLVLADFGISSVMQDGSEEVVVIASNTDLYAAPELARKGNNITVEITPAVDYFALGITMYELWLGEQPFKEIKQETRERHIRSGSVIFPINMPDDCKTLIKGLIKLAPNERWGNKDIQKWLKGEILALDFSKPGTVTGIVYDPPLKFVNESAANQKELAALMEKYPKAGKDCLYEGFITDALKKAGDVTMYSDIKDVISLYKDRDAGLSAAIYTLDPERPFISRTGKICNSCEEIADAIMADSAHYMDELKNNTNADFYIYITVTEGSQGKDKADTFRKFFRDNPPNRALTLVFLRLQSDGGITLGSKRYLSTDELAQEKDNSQIDLIKKAVNEKDSPLLVWIFDKYGDYFKSTDEFVKQNIPEQFFMLSLIPFLSFAEHSGNTGEAALQDLIDHYPGRSDLFETYVTQGLPLKGQILDSPIKKTPIDYVVCNYYDLISMHGSDTVCNLIRLLCKLGADVNEYSSDGRCPYINAISRDGDLVKLLVELGAEENFISKGGKICKKAEDIAEAIMNESAYYMDDLKNPKADLYLYLIATEGAQGMEFAEKSCKFFEEYYPKRAIALVYLQLQSDLDITIGSKRYQNIEDLKQEKDNAQIDSVKKAVMEKDSLLLSWISINDDYFESLKPETMEAFGNLPANDQFHLLWLLPYLSYKELKGSDWEQSAISDLKYLIDHVPDRSNCFEVYARQSLPLNGQILEKKTPIDYIVCSFNDLSNKHGADTVCKLIRLLCKLGVDINEYSNDGTFPLVNAFESFFAGKIDLIKLLLELGADANQYSKFLLASPLKKTPIDYIVCSFNDLSSKHDTATVCNLIRLLCKIGADINEYSSDGTFPLVNAFESFFAGKNDLIKLLLELGADANLYRDFLGRRENKERIEQEDRLRSEAKKLELTESKKRKEYDERERQRITSEKKVKIKRIIILAAIIIPISIIAGYGLYNGWFVSNRHLTTSDTVTTTRDSNEWYGDFKYQLHDGNISITDYNGTSDELVIPAELGNYPVTIIGDQAFKAKNLTSVTIGNSVTSIRDNAFADNNITNIVIPGSVTSIGLNAFANNPLTSISLGANVRLGSDGNYGALGLTTGFNSAYANNGNRAGTYTRSGTNTTTWTRR